MQILYILLQRSKQQYRQRSYLSLLLLCCFLFATNVAKVNGEGSVDFIEYDGFRLFYSANIDQQLKVYVNEGEYINFGTSHLGITGGSISIYRPDGMLHETFQLSDDPQPLGTPGIMFNSDQEKAGPTGGGSTNGAGYVPLVIQAGSGQAGVWSITFNFPNPTLSFFNSFNKRNDAPWERQNSQPRNQRGIIGWDVTVSQNAAGNEGGTLLTGRLFSNEYVSVVSGNGNTTSPTFYVLTRDGYLYQVDFPQTDPFEFPLSSSSTGLVDGSLNPLYKSLPVNEYLRSDNPTLWTPDGQYQYTPQRQDFGPIINNKIFFNPPNSDMPTTATVVDLLFSEGGAIASPAYETWLYSEPEATSATISNFGFSGSEACPDNSILVNSEGFFVFESSVGGRISISLDINEDGDFEDPEDVVLEGFTQGGPDSLFWNGQDGNGNSLVGVAGNITFNLRIVIRSAEVHIMMQDVENDLGGVNFNLLNAPDAQNANNFYYDHRAISNGSAAEDSFVSGDDPSGEPAPTTVPYTFGNGFGDENLLDYWAFVEFLDNNNNVFTLTIRDECEDPVVDMDDFDMDGINDDIDIDDDNDGLPDYLEYCNATGDFSCLPLGVDPSGDEDGDGISNYEDTDINDCTDEDADGRCDVVPAVYDKDGDGVPNHHDLDNDNDGITDLVEAGHGQPDANGDGIIDGEPTAFGANGLYNPIASDPDALDATATYTPFDKDLDGIPDYIDLDSDNDGITDVAEAGYTNVDLDNDGMIDRGLDTDPYVNRYGLVNIIDPDRTGQPIPNPIDFDGDGIDDRHDLDSDNDGIHDVSELSLILVQDPDNDGQIREGIPEVNECGLAIIDSLGIILVITSNPLDFDGDGIPDWHDLDSDNDGIFDSVEAFGGDFDPDFDGILGEGDPTVNDNGQVISGGTLGTSFPIDTDNDNLGDFRDLDSDNDNIADINECDGTIICPDMDDNGIDDYREPNCNESNSPVAMVVQTETDVNCADVDQLTYTVTNTGFSFGNVFYIVTLPDGNELTGTLGADSTATFTVGNLGVNGEQNLTVILQVEFGCPSEPVSVLVDCMKDDVECTDENTPNIGVLTTDSNINCINGSATFVVQNDGFNEGAITYTATLADGTIVTGTLNDDGSGNIEITGITPEQLGTATVVLTAANGCMSAPVTIELEALTNVVANDDTTSVAPNSMNNVINVLDNDAFAQAMITIVTPPTMGNVVIDPATGTIIYTPNADVRGMDSFTYQLCEANCPTICDEATVIITIEGCNDIVLDATNDFFTMTTNGSLSGNIFNNDSFDRADTISFELLTNVTNGTLTTTDRGTFTYIPDMNFAGQDTFTYVICYANCNNVCDTATAIFNVIPPVECDETNTPNIGTLANNGASSSCVGGNASFTIINDGFNDGAITYTATLADGTEITGVLNSDGVVTFNLEDITAEQAGTITVVLMAENGCMSTPVTIELVVLTEVTANDDNVIIESGTTDNAINVLGNDSSTDVTVTIITVPTAGTASVDPATNEVIYTPNAGFAGMDSLTYQICSVSCPDVCDTATINITVNPIDCTPENTPTIGTFTANNSGTLCVGGEVTYTVTNTGFNEGTITFVATLADGSEVTGTLDENNEGTFTINGVSTDQAGTITIVLISEDGCTSAPVTIELIVVDDIVAVSDMFDVVNTGTIQGATVLTNDEFNADSPVEVSVIENTQNGELTLINAQDGTFNYVPNEGFVGVDSFTYQVCYLDCPTVLCSVTTVYINVTEPMIDCDMVMIMAVNDTFDIQQNMSVGDLPIFDNDDFDMVTVMITSEPTLGTVMVDDFRVVSYTPNMDATGTDSFTYQICDADCPDVCSSATVTINILQDCTNVMIDAVDDTFTVNQDETLTGVNVLTNDDANIVTITINTQSINGTLTLDDNGDVTYVPNAGFFGEDTFVYQICDTTCPDVCDQATATITVVEVDPCDGATITANDDSFSTNQDMTLTGVNIFANDEGTIGTVQVNVLPIQGNLTLEGNGNITYEPNAGFSGTDMFTYTICDVNCPDVCDQATVTITVVDPCDGVTVTASDDEYEVNVDETLDVNILDNDDFDMVTITIDDLSGVTNGSVTVEDDGRMVYIPFQDADGTDMFTYTICDVNCPDVCSSATVTINAMGMDNPCDDVTIEVMDETFTIEQDTDLNININTGTVTIDMTTTNGTLTVGADGVINYVPNAGFFGTDSFTYTVCDVDCPDVCDQATITIIVTEAPDPCADVTVGAMDDSFTVDQDMTLTGVNILDNDDANMVTITVDMTTANGTLTIGNNGDITYVPNAGFFGSDSFIYTICDVNCPDVCASATATINVTEIPDPCADRVIETLDDTFTVDQDGSITMTGVELFGNDNITSFDFVITIEMDVANGTLVSDGDEGYIYTPNAGFSGTDMFVYQICYTDCPDICDMATVTINVTPMATPCDEVEVDAVDDTFVIDFNGVSEGANILDNDSSTEVVITINKNADNGTLTVDADGTVTYTPNRFFFGEDNFTYTICDINCPDVCDEATVTLSVQDMECYIPNFVTPNGDGDNDLFQIPCAENVFTNNRLTIYNRWGDVVFEQDSYQNNWDATHDGEAVPAGVYFYLFQLDRDNEECRQGFITVVK